MKKIKFRNIKLVIFNIVLGLILSTMLIKTWVIILCITLIFSMYYFYNLYYSIKNEKVQKLKDYIESEKDKIWEERNKNNKNEKEEDYNIAKYLGISIEDYNKCVSLYNLSNSCEHEEKRRALINLERRLESLGVSFNAFKKLAVKN